MIIPLDTVSFDTYRGELAALATAGCWTVSALAFSAAANRMGPLTYVRGWHWRMVTRAPTHALASESMAPTITMLTHR